MPIQEMTPQEANDKLQNADDYQLIDVREEDEYAEVHAEGAVNIPLSQLQERYSEIPQGRQTILICRSGGRSMKAAEFLEGQGYRDLYNLSGGTNDWVSQELPHVRPASRE
ncbi:rhodanese-like domain-containing protein [Deinococcus radiophilus]|uniref:Rhodanese-like domain-containing protein n=1 Tax=Deinococcus radiophilus TaxID=32062 RepID=A0A431W1X7_9DEIO|nr:rhodanese-like domain-containing protein [Deinococcus radiophilus]RTR29455.1 rhodanese-like domain-containing protein [Deinococcus radiophilus]UFA50709.1 rhodanese-like domain-containing protein [Deinococcus radiophilus]